jgi:hypothetical protein
MLYFPQLLTGALVQYPISRTVSWRTILNTLPGGSTVKSRSEEGARISWDFVLEGLSDSERSEVEGLYVAADGAYRDFTFLDPCDNLLSWSGDMTKPVWVCDPLLTVTGGAQDVFGGSTAARLANHGPLLQALGQAVFGPGQYRYCFSMYGRALAGVQLNMVMKTSSSQVEVSKSLTGEWSRLVIAGIPGTADESVTFQICLDPGSVIEICAPQVEAQPSPSPPKTTHAISGVYPSTHFVDSELMFTTDAPGLHSVRLKLESRVF